MQKLGCGALDVIALLVDLSEAAPIDREDYIFTGTFMCIVTVANDETQ